MAGRLRHRLEIQTSSPGRHPGTGQPVKVWSTVAERWGSVEPMRGAELFQAQQVAPRVSHKVTIRGRTQIAPSQRVLHKGRALNIEYVTDVQERGILVVAYATETAA